MLSQATRLLSATTSSARGLSKSTRDCSARNLDHLISMASLVSLWLTTIHNRSTGEQRAPSIRSRIRVAVAHVGPSPQLPLSSPATSSLTEVICSSWLSSNSLTVPTTATKAAMVALLRRVLLGRRLTRSCSRRTIRTQPRLGIAIKIPPRARSALRTMSLSWPRASSP